MKKTRKIKNVYLIGIGGIGMSALARYYHTLGYQVSGYDRTATSLTAQMINEGIDIHFTDEPGIISNIFKSAEDTMVVYTPAVPASNNLLNYFSKNHFELIKRSEALGRIVASHKGIAVSGSHGKTTISGMIAHILGISGINSGAFLGGISKNLNSNLMFSENPEYIVVEADEYDRSFLQLFPEITIITAIDPDHLDIYGDYPNLLSSFRQFALQTNKGGTLIIKTGLPILQTEGIKTISYGSGSPADYHPVNIRMKKYHYVFDVQTPDGIERDIELGIYGRVNIENAIAAFVACKTAGVGINEIKQGVKTYEGIYRRFDVLIEKDDFIYIDDYAHHPEELRAFVGSVKEIFPGKRLAGIFQPHLYSRTKDFAEEFAASLSLLDDVILLPIYPAREDPIEGVDSGLIFSKLTNRGKRVQSEKEELLEVIKNIPCDVLLTMGAGDIDKLVLPIKNYVNQKKSII